MLLRLFSRSSIFLTFILKKHNFNAICISVLFLISQTFPAHLLHVCHFYVHTPYDARVFCHGVSNNLKIKFGSLDFSFVHAILYLLKSFIIYQRFH
jgi:hypothetical protein